MYYSHNQSRPLRPSVKCPQKERLLFPASTWKKCLRASPVNPKDCAWRRIGRRRDLPWSPRGPCILSCTIGWCCNWAGHYWVSRPSRFRLWAKCPWHARDTGWGSEWKQRGCSRGRTVEPKPVVEWGPISETMQFNRKQKLKQNVRKLLNFLLKN